MTPAHKSRKGSRPASATACDACRTHFDSPRHLVAHLYYNPSHVHNVPFAGQEADRAYGQVGR